MNKKKSLIALSAVALGSVLYNYLKPIRSNVEVVRNFDINKYLGLWYEIARLDFKHEKNLRNVSATYEFNEDGSIKVLNQGIDMRTGELKQRTGKAKFIDSETEGALKVSFFGPFYSGYNIVQLNPNYEDVLIFGENLDYMWILSRTKELSEDRKKIYLDYALAYGYQIQNLVWTNQEDLVDQTSQILAE